MEISAVSGQASQARETPKSASNRAPNELIERIIEGEWQEGDHPRTQRRWRQAEPQDDGQFSRAQASYAPTNRLERRALAAYQANVEISNFPRSQPANNIDFFA